jgi:hypothetical protein
MKRRYRLILTLLAGCVGLATWAGLRKLEPRASAAPVCEHLPDLPNQSKLAPKLCWADADGTMPADAVSQNYQGYRNHAVCRVFHSGGIHLGKLMDPNTCNIGYGRNGLIIHRGGDFRMQILRNPEHVQTRFVRTKPNAEAVIGGVEPNGTPQYVCATTRDGETNPGKYFASSDRCNYEWAYKEEEAATDFGLLLLSEPPPPPKPGTDDHGNCGPNARPCTATCPRDGNWPEITNTLCCSTNPRPVGCGCMTRTHTVMCGGAF